MRLLNSNEIFNAIHSLDRQIKGIIFETVDYRSSSIDIHEVNTFGNNIVINILGLDCNIVRVVREEIENKNI